MVKRKSSSGRQKIPIEKIAKKSHLQVTFSKRRSGLFKKASELCTLCGVEIAIIVFSPADKAFSFGHPEVESIIDCYLIRNSPQELSTDQFVESHRNSIVCNLNMQLSQILNQLEIERKRGDELEQLRKARQRQFWWEIPIEELGLQELQHLMFSMEEFQKTVAQYGSKMLMEQTTMTSPIIGPGPNIFGLCDAFNNKSTEIYANANSSTITNASGLSFQC
ncbi:hypothetical protein VNO77_41727 [Canavalia gladiata]|uniref:MADS-box domain-containing protein n=1 Tax=Canavalia gladiata TaxID=3824 RepID=A0AAN9JZE9_CANGL